MIKKISQLCFVGFAISSAALPMDNVSIALELALEIAKPTEFFATREKNPHTTLEAKSSNSLLKSAKIAKTGQSALAALPAQATAIIPASSMPTFVLKVGDMMKMPVDCIVNPANNNIQQGGGVTGIITENKIPSNSSSTFNPPLGDTSGKVLKELKILKDKKISPIDDKGNLPEGKAVITGSGSIKNQSAKTIRFVVSTVGPQGPGNKTKDILLHDAYYSSLRLASDFKHEARNMLSLIDSDLSKEIVTNPIKAIAFPSISTGIFNYPLKANESEKTQGAGAIAIEAICNGLTHNSQLKQLNNPLVVAYLVVLNQTGDDYQAYAQEIQNTKYNNIPVRRVIEDIDGKQTVIFDPSKK